MPQLLSFFQPGNLGNIVGAGSDGVLGGILTPVAPDKFLLKGQAAAGLCITDDGGLHINETTPFGNATADDVELLAAVPANDDAVYFGHATVKFGRVDLNITTTGVGTWTITYYYWDGSAYVALANVVDGTGGFTGAGTGWKTITFDVPTDWAKNTVDGVLAYWIQGVVSGYSAVTTPPQAGQGWLILETPVWTDDTTDFGDADTGDVKLLPDYPIVDDAAYIGHSEQFCALKVTTSVARTGTATLVVKYWDGTTWSALPVVADYSVGWSATAGTHLILFQPPADWVACLAENGPNSQTGFFVSMELTALTSMTAQPLATRGWVSPITTGATGLSCPASGTITKVSMNAQTKSASNADSQFVLLNVTKGTSVGFTWTKAIALVEETISLAVTKDDELILLQVKEDGTTEFANAQFWFTLAA